jgi:SET domain/RNA recognition motif. (a.k.a. RRM, RBD, or RNP domain)
MASDINMGVDLSIMGTDVFDFGLDHNEPPPTDKRKDTYEEIMGIGERGNKSLSNRLVSFREWLDQDAKVVIHPHLCIVNGESSDGTKNAPVLSYGPPPGVNTANNNQAEGRIGVIDSEADQALYDRSMGCQVRATKEIKKDDVLLIVPRQAMVTPDLVAASDAGRAVMACIETGNDSLIHFWDPFENTATLEMNFQEKIGLCNGTQLLVKILQERKKAETAEMKSLQLMDQAMQNFSGLVSVGRSKIVLPFTLAAWGKISTRAVILAFLIHQRFSDSIKPEIRGVAVEISEEMDDCKSCLSSSATFFVPHASPISFGPYARILPSAVSLPICWKRNELALFSQCVPGIKPLQEVARMTLLLASEFVALVDAGILHRFPSVFPRGLITWERWVWAASVYTSRVLPASMYLNKEDENAHSHQPANPTLFQSDAAVWTELGVMIPFLDMLNHEVDAAQVVWEPASLCFEGETAESLPKAISHKRVKKGSELYCNYGPNLTNEHLILQYGFGLINNPSDEARMGWSLADCVGNVEIPKDYSPPFRIFDFETRSQESTPVINSFSDSIEKKQVFESSDPLDIKNWWTDARLSLLNRQALIGDSTLASLTAGKKMITAALNDGSYHPHLLAAAVVATMDEARVRYLDGLSNSESENGTNPLAIGKSHQMVLRAYLAFHFTGKLEKLLKNLNNGLKGHFDDVNVWLKGLDGTEVKSDQSQKTEGWNKFFEAKAYVTSAAVEKRFYPVSPESCVLALYDGQVRALYKSIEGLETMEKFRAGVLRQLEDLDFNILSDDDISQEDTNAVNEEFSIKEEDIESVNKPEDGPIVDEDGVNGKSKEKNKTKNRRRNRKKANGGDNRGLPISGIDGRPAIKLHIGNLAYCTLASDLFEYFASAYGRESVLECHIPTERETGRSRGFGFVTMPEAASLQALQPGKKHEVHGRILKIAESSSAGSANRNRGPGINTIVVTDRCARCGYRPRYCVCPVPDIPAFNGIPGRFPHPPDMRGPEFPDTRGRGDPEYDYYGGSHRRDRERGRDSFSPSPVHHRSGIRGPRDWEYDWRGYDHDRSRRSRSPSYGHERERDRDRSRRRSRDRDKDRDRDRDRERSRERRRSHEDRRSSRYSRSRSPVEEDPEVTRSSRRDRDYDRRSGGVKGAGEHIVDSKIMSDTESMTPTPIGLERKRSRESRRRSRSRSASCSHSGSRSRSRSRSRDRGKSGKRKRSSKKEGKKRDRSPH